MNCSLYHHLIYKIRLAEVKTETYEIERLERELAQHLKKCATCNGLHAAPLADNLFGQSVKVSEQ